MNEDRNDLVLKLLRDLRAGQETFQNEMAEFRKEMHSMRIRVEEMHETSITALGLAGHANVQHQTMRLGEWI